MPDAMPFEWEALLHFARTHHSVRSECLVRYPSKYDCSVHHDPLLFDLLSCSFSNRRVAHSCRIVIQLLGQPLINEVPGNLAPSTHIGSFRKELAAAQMRKVKNGHD